jgi:hypothetical protein
LPGARQVYADRLTTCPQKAVRNLNQNARTVAGGGVGTNGPTVIKINQRQNGIADDLVAFAAFEINNKTDATGIVFKGGVVKALSFRAKTIHWQFRVKWQLGHGSSDSFANGTELVNLEAIGQKAASRAYF